MHKKYFLFIFILLIVCNFTIADKWEIEPNCVNNLELYITSLYTAKINIPLNAVNENVCVNFHTGESIISPPATALGPAILIDPEIDFHNIATLYLPFSDKDLPSNGQKMEICVWYKRSQRDRPVVIAENQLSVDRKSGIVALEIKKTGAYQVGVFGLQSANWAPAAFSLRQPENAAVFKWTKDSDIVRFSWQEAVDPNDDRVYYHVVFADDPQLNNRITTLSSGQDPYLAVSVATLREVLNIYDRTVFWGVEASDSEFSTLSMVSRSLTFTGQNGVSAIAPLVFDYGANWSYDDSDNLDSKSWKSLQYDDRNWSEGKGLFGFGYWHQEKPVTELKSSRTTYYFRKKIILDVKPVCLTARVKYDDSFAFYVNGQEVYRHNIKNDADYDDYADSKSCSLKSFSIPGEYLHIGENVFAVEVHQSGWFSSDIAMDARVENGKNSVAIAWGPWLTLPIENSMTVVWETSEPADSELHYGLSASLGTTVSDSENTKLHKLVASDLEPGKRYYYKVVSAGVHSAIKSFMSPPARNSKTLIGIYGDTRTDYSMHQVVIEAMAANNPGLILNSGDIVEDGNDISQWYEQFLSPSMKVIEHIPMIGSLGNHDGSAGGNMWKFLPISPKAPNPEKIYNFSFTYGPLAILVIDTDTAYAKGSEQYAYIEADLKKYSRQGYWILAIFHKPAYSSGVGHGGIENPKIAEDLVMMFERYGVDFVINGHDHFFERSFKEGVHHLVAGGGGALPGFGNFNVNPYKVYNKNFVYCYTLLSIDPYGYKLTTYTPEGKKLDELVLDGKRPRIYILQPEGSVEKFDDDKDKYRLDGPKGAFTANRERNYRIYFNAEDRDSNARISLYLDKDNSGQDGTLIGENIFEDNSRYFDWHVPANFPTGVYYIYGIIDDGSEQGTDYSHFTIKVE